ncbi:HAD family hydrolase [Allobaculum sp. JKK-2023]|uniref:HAD family hydrolase n=1 Tax=Allobaculum sp. JKK-2023 TaxID=3108943 RepID=UPI003A599C29
MPVLHQLHDRGWQLVLLSNTDHLRREKHLEVLDHCFDGAVIADEVHCYKPDLSFFRIAEKQYLRDGKNHIHIAAGYWWDIVPATKLGWKKIWVDRRCHVRTGIRKNQW